MISVECKVTITLEGESARLFSLMCKSFLDDSQTRLTPEQFREAKRFAMECNQIEAIWRAK